MNQKFHSLYFIGIKGVGMSALAIVAKGMGYAVTGSDVAEEFITDAALRQADLEAKVGFTANHLTGDIDLVIVGAAISHDNPEYLTAKERSLPLWTYSELLGYL